MVNNQTFCLPFPDITNVEYVWKFSTFAIN